MIMGNQFLGMPIYLYAHPTDMRCSFNGLCGIVRNHLSLNPVSDGLFVFLNRIRDRMKLLHWGGDGFWLYYKQLERGSFEVPLSSVDSSCICLSSDQLSLILSGIELGSVIRRKRYSCKEA